MISFLIMTKDRLDETIECLLSIKHAINMSAHEYYEICILVNGGDQESISLLENATVEMLFDCDKKVVYTFHYSKSNLGVAGGRNKLFSIAQGQILVFIDDDAELANPDTFVDKLIEVQNKFPKVGAIAFNSLDKNGNCRDCEIPIKRELKANESEILVSHFIGVGHVLFRHAIGRYSYLYPAELFYGMEEYFLSYKILNDGFEIVYAPSLGVIHKKSPKTRLLPIDYYVYLASNKIFIGSLLGHKVLSMSHLLLWTGWVFLKTKQCRAVLQMFKRLNWLKRSEKEYYIGLDQSCINRVKAIGGRVWY